MNDITTEKQNKRPNVPPLRFPEFTDEWKKERIRHLFCINVGGDIDKALVSPILTDFYKYPIIANALSNNGIYGYTTKYKGETPCITVTGRGDVGVAKYRDYPLYPIVRLLVLHSNGEIDCQFGEYAINAIKKYVESTGVPQLTAPQLGAYSITYPSLNEQVKIGSFFSMLDKRIAAQNKIIEDLRQLKSALVDEFFCGKSNWVAYKYKEILCPISERNKALKITNVLSASQEHGMISRDELDIDIKFESSAISTYKIVQPGDYVLHLRSFQGGLAFSRITGICSPAYTILRPTKVVTYGFFEEFFMSKRFINSLRLVTYGIRDGRSINVDEFLNMNISIPNMDTQRKLVQILSVFRQRLNNAQTILQKYISQKQFLLRQMFI